MYTMTIGNPGPSDAAQRRRERPDPVRHDVHLRHAVDRHLQLRPPELDHPALTVGGSATLTSTDRINTASAVVNGATITTLDQPDFNPSNESGSTTLNPIVPTTDIAVLKSIDKSTVRVGQTSIATVTVNNLGPFPATGVTVATPCRSVSTS